MKNRLKKVSTLGLLAATLIFEFSAFLLLALRNEEISFIPIAFFLVLAGMQIVQYVMYTVLFKDSDRFALIICNLLVGIGIIMILRTNQSMAIRQMVFYGVGILLMPAVTGLIINQVLIRKLSLPFMIISVIILTLLFFVGKEEGGAKNWIKIGEMSFQPSEFVKLALVIVLADWMAERTKVRTMIPVVVFVIIVMGLLVAERDLGAALLIGGTSLIVFYIATGKKTLSLLALGAGAGGAVLSYYLFDHVKARVQIWIDPWETYHTTGYQIAQGLMAIASGGLWGIGLTLGSPKLIPAYNTDYIFAIICEEFGIIFGLCVIALYILLVVRGALISLNAPNRFLSITAIGCITMIALQSFIIIGGVTKLIPLTGITLPFVSYGGTSIITSMMMLGLFQGIAISGKNKLEKDIAVLEAKNEL